MHYKTTHTTAYTRLMQQCQKEQILEFLVSEVHSVQVALPL